MTCFGLLQRWRQWRENGLVWKTEFYPQVNSERLAVTIFVEEDSEAASNLAGNSGMINE